MPFTITATDSQANTREPDTNWIHAQTRSTQIYIEPLGVPAVPVIVVPPVRVPLVLQ